MKGEFSRFATLAVAMMLAWMWLGATAHAHASLVATQPRDGAMLAAAPSTLALTFNEPVSLLSAALVRPDGTSQALDRFELKDGTVEIAAPADLGRGTHILSWRVISEDGHPVSGSVVFSIGEASAAPPVVEDAVDWTVRAGLWAGKVALYAGLFIGAGGAFAIGWLLRGERHGRSAVLAAIATGLAGALVSAGFQGLDALGAPSARLADPVIWWTGMGTSFGRTVVVAILALAAAAVSLLSDGVGGRMWSLAGLLLGGVALSLSGHASAAEPQWLTRPAVFVHGAAIAFWAGALVPLGIALKHGSPQALPALGRFSAAVPFIVALLVAAGAALAVIQVGRPAALIETAYGQVLLVKLGLLAVLFALAAVNRWRLTKPVEAGDAAATRHLVRSIAAETAVVLVIFAVAACWRFTPPPRALAAAAALPEAVHIHTAKAMADLSITPGRAGPVDVSVMIMTGDFGALDAKEVTLAFTNPGAGIEPIRRAAFKPGDGTWRVEGLILPLAGTWRVRVDILISDFEMARLEGDIRVRP